MNNYERQGDERMGASHKVRTSRTFRAGPYLNSLFREAERMHEDLRREICARIRQARKKGGFTQQEMADLLGLTLRGYQNYEGARVPWDRIGDIARLTGTTEEWLLRGDPPVVAAGDADRLASLERSVDHLQESVQEILHLVRGGAPVSTGRAKR